MKICSEERVTFPYAIVWILSILQHLPTCAFILHIVLLMYDDDDDDDYWWIAYHCVVWIPCNV